METGCNAPWPVGEWRGALADVITDVDELLRMLGLEDGSPSAHPSALRGFPLRVPRGFVDRMRPGDPSDPLLRQVLPIVLPQRVDAELVGWLGDLHVPVVVVVHANHANEIDDSVRRALAALATAGATLLNQSVLLGGVNDTVDALTDLSEALFEAGVMPYYLHMLDPVEGSAHFDVSEREAQRVHRELVSRLSGYLVPRLVREVPGAPAKVAVDLWR